MIGHVRRHNVAVMPVLAGLLGWVALAAAVALSAGWPLVVYGAAVVALAVASAVRWVRDSR
jgi:hypothetical protein